MGFTALASWPRRSSWIATHLISEGASEDVVRQVHKGAGMLVPNHKSLWRSRPALFSQYSPEIYHPITKTNQTCSCPMDQHKTSIYTVKFCFTIQTRVCIKPDMQQEFMATTTFLFRPMCFILERVGQGQFLCAPFTVLGRKHKKSYRRIIINHSAKDFHSLACVKELLLHNFRRAPLLLLLSMDEDTIFI